MKAKAVAVALLLLSLVPLSGCAKSGAGTGEAQPTPTEAPAPVYQKISAEDAYRRMREDAPYILVDVRTQAEFDTGYIEGAILLPDYEIEKKAKELLPDPDAVILLYCRSGRRSAEAAQKLLDLGYTNVYDFGGIIDWPYETVGGGM